MRRPQPPSCPGFPGRVGAVLALSLLGGASCARCTCSGTHDPGGRPFASGAPSAAPDAGSACKIVGNPMRFGVAIDVPGDEAAGAAPAPFAAEVGEAAVSDIAFFVGVADSAGAHVLRVDLDGTASKRVGTWSIRDATFRPPLVTIDDSGGVLAGLLRIDDGRRTFIVERMRARDAGAPPGEPHWSRVGSIEQDADESEATTLLASPGGEGGGGGVTVLWDDSDSLRERGRIRFARLGSGAPPTPERGERPPDVVSPRESDASWPTLVGGNDRDRALALWLAERPESTDVPDGGAGEPSQAETYRWLEGAVIDLSTGRTLAPPRVLTPKLGHVRTFSAARIDGSLLVVLRDDARPTDGDGGDLVALRAPIDDTAIGEPTSTLIAHDDVAPGTPFLMAGRREAAAFYLTLSGETRRVPLAAGGAAPAPSIRSVSAASAPPIPAMAPSAATSMGSSIASSGAPSPTPWMAPSLEPSLRNRRVVAARGERVLASRLLGAGLEFAVAECRIAL